MTCFDVFNGDADGMCALRQLRLAEPRQAIRITGLKRDILLLRHVRAQTGDAVTVLDISMAANRAALDALLQQGVSVQYFDHHFAGDVPVHPGLFASIDPEPETCTGMLVDRFLGGRFRVWAVVAAFGDNLERAACRIAAPLSLPPEQLALLRELGECLNYNAYGDTDADPVLHPAALYTRLERYDNPFHFMRNEPVFPALRHARHQDLEMAHGCKPYTEFPGGCVYILPDNAASRRVRGEFGNLLANTHPSRAHAVLTPNIRGGYTVSVRAPLADLHGARELCAQFETGGGRSGAAGITHLPPERLPAFLDAFGRAFPRTPESG